MFKYIIVLKKETMELFSCACDIESAKAEWDVKYIKALSVKINRNLLNTAKYYSNE